MDDVVNTTIARKVVLLGDQNVGKTCIVLRYVEGTFGTDVTSTIGENRELTQALIHLNDLQHQFRKTNKFLHLLLTSLIKRAHGSYDHIKDVLLRLDYNFYYNKQ